MRLRWGRVVLGLLAVFVLAFAALRLREQPSDTAEQAAGGGFLDPFRGLFGGDDETAAELAELQGTVDALMTQQAESAHAAETRAREEGTEDAVRSTAGDLEGTAGAIQRQLTSEANIASAQETVGALQDLADNQATKNAMVSQSQATEITRLQTEVAATSVVAREVIRATAVSDMPTGVVVGPVAEASASSNLNHYNTAMRAIDRSTAIPWVSGSLDLSGSWLEFSYKVDKIVNGIRLFQMNNQQFARPEHVALIFSDESTQRISLRG